MTKRTPAGKRYVYYFADLPYRDCQYDDPFLESHLENLTKERLEEKGYKADDDHVDVYFDLGYSQGSHFYFTGNIIDVKTVINYGISQKGAGYTTHITTEDSEGNDIDAPQSVYDDVAQISREMMRAGYNEIEYQNSNEQVDENIEANEYTFTLDGVRMNPDF
jgi:hypothetical protein